MSDYIDEIFGTGGALAGKFPGYQPRPGQVALARAVDAAIRTGKHLLAEAPTGTGKSVAYAVPAAYHTAHNGGAAVLVTANIALQEQLVRKDLPLLAEILPWKFTYALLKGKQNYLCLEKLENGAYDDSDDQDLQISRWAATTRTGDVSELPFEPPARLWSRFSVSSDECTGKECEFFKECHSENARKRARDAQIVVTNYHLFFADMHVRDVSNGIASILPDYSIAILDEGHKAVDIARDFFGFRIAEGSIRWAGGMLTDNAVKAELESAQNAFFSSLLAYRRSGQYRARIRQRDVIDAKPLLAALEKTSASYDKLYKSLCPRGDDELSTEERKRLKKINTRYQRTEDLRVQIQSAMRLYALPKAPWVKHPSELDGGTPETSWYWSDPLLGGDNLVKSEAQLAILDDVHFIEDEKGGQVSLCSKPVSVAEILRDQLFEVTGEQPSVTITSATLVARGSFDYVTKDLGVQNPAMLVAQSPFSWRDQVLLVLPPDVPEPNHPAFVQAAAAKCAEVIQLAKGRTLALFTSYKNLNAAHEKALSLRLPYRILRQGDMPRTKLIDEFRKDTSSVLFGTESFWAGVDVPGESLSCVFIDKLPFTTPEDPIMDALTERDKDWFKKYSVPRAIIAFKQGFGRLIRTTTDRGVVVVLDKRITTKFYGHFFIDALPQIQQSSNIEDVRRFLDREPVVGKATVDAHGYVAPSVVSKSLFDL